MTRTTKHVMRLVLIALLFQFVCPVFVITTTFGAIPSEHKYTFNIHPHNSSLILPLLLKEKDETETEIEDINIDFVTLIDFSNQSSILTEHHETKLTPFVFPDQIDHHPPFFTLYNVFLI